jgi:hypothetical protein
VILAAFWEGVVVREAQIGGRRAWNPGALDSRFADFIRSPE